MQMLELGREERFIFEKGFIFIQVTNFEFISTNEERRQTVKENL
jgi:hypothetical protein